MEKHSVSRMIGAPPGYVGYDEGGYLTEHVRRRPYSVVLFDEIEKAHQDVFNVLLQILEDGRLTDGQGRTVDFRNTVIIMTSNVGSDMIKEQASLGFRHEIAGTHTEDELKRKVLDALRLSFRPEFLNRIDEIIVFHSLTEEHISLIVEIQLKHLKKRLAERRMNIELTEAAKQKLATLGFDPNFGARPLKRTIQREIQDVLASKILGGEFKEGDSVLVDVNEDGEIAFCHAHEAQQPLEQAA